MSGQLQRRPIRTNMPVIRRGNDIDKAVQSATTFIQHLLKQLSLTLLATLFKHSATKLEGKSKTVAKMLGGSDEEDQDSQKRLYNNHYNNNYPSQDWTNYGSSQRDFPMTRSRY